MTVAYAKDLFAAGVCPGCGTRLELVAGVGDHHTLDGMPVTTAEASLHVAGMCAWSADDLTSLVLVGTGVVK